MYFNMASLLLFIMTDIGIPVITHDFSDIRVSTDTGMPSAVVTWTTTVTATDNSGFVTLTSNYQSGDAFPIGRTNVVYTATDRSGNIATVSFSVVVEGKFIGKFIGKGEWILIASHMFVIGSKHEAVSLCKKC